MLSSVWVADQFGLGESRRDAIVLCVFFPQKDSLSSLARALVFLLAGNK